MKNNTLEQVLTVLKYSKYNYNSGITLTSSYQDAIARVAKESEVKYQTIGDGCRRRLKLNSIGEFSELLRKWLDGDSKPLIDVLKSQTSKLLHPKIDSFFENNEVSKDNPSGNEENIEKDENTIELSFLIKETDYRYLKALCHIQGIEEKELIKTIVSDGIKERMKKVIQYLR